MNTYIINQEKDFAEILLHGAIGMWQQSDSKKFISDLKNLEKNYKRIHVRLNTIGGDVFAGISIYNALKNSPSEIHCYVDGIAASMGSVICLAGKRIFMSKYGQLMIHRVSGTASGDAENLVETANLMLQLEDSLIDIYANRTGLSHDEIRNNWMARGQSKYFSAAQALESKLIDEIYDGPVKKQAPANIPVNQAWEFYNENFLAIYNKTRKMENLSEFISFYNLSETASLQEILACMQNERNENHNLKSEIDLLKAENQKFQGQLETETKNKIQTLIDTAVKEKRILETQRSIYTALAESNFSATKSALEGIKPYVPISVQIQNNANDNSDLMTIIDWQKKNPKGLAEMQIKNPELYCSLYEKHYGVKPNLNNFKN
jgi:ATP-dependent Clp endopeptidase proteolytic subunit ClpP